MGTLIGEIRAFPHSFVPKLEARWLPCDGSILTIKDYPDLYSVIGARFGQTALSNFALPDMRGRTVAGAGQGPGLTSRAFGARWGTPEVTLTVDQIPQHRHVINTEFSTSVANLKNAPEPGLALSRTGNQYNYSNETLQDEVRLHPKAFGETGQGQAHENRQPSLAVNYFICVAPSEDRAHR
ncbi:MAG: hypothetical protein B7X99_17885 [Rhizobiales bacterium 17-65-6]|nr:MAG: hypothetical protein B7X99_17885 [Rhizobiales bacterium 17-65-6]